MSDSLRLLGDGRRVRVAFGYHQSGPSGRLAYVDICDPAARGDIRPQTVRLPTDEKLEWAGGTAGQGALRDHDGPITILDADGTLSPWHRPGWRPVAATADVVDSGYDMLTVCLPGGASRSTRSCGRAATR